MKLILKICFSLLLIFTISFFPGCRRNEETEYNNQSSQLFALDTVIDITAYGENSEKAMKAAEDEIHRLEKIFSVTDNQSDIYKLNNSASNETVIDSEAYILLDYAKYINTITEGNFDVTVYPVMELWGFTDKNYKVPDESEIAEALSLVNSKNIVLKENYTARLNNNAKVDLGGIAKGYIADKAAQAMKNAGVEYGIISLGGNIRTVGTKPSGENFKIGIKHPDSDEYFAIIDTGDCSVITSGAYQRNFTREGKTYHHIIDPETGYPADSDIQSVTIIGEDGALCDALSTAIFIGGSDYAAKLYKQSIFFDYAILTKDYKVIASQGLQERLSIADGFEHLDITYR